MPSASLEERRYDSKELTIGCRGEEQQLFWVATAAHPTERSEWRCDTEAEAYCTLEGQAAEIRGGGVYCTKKEE